jgi:hypothetical protein
MSAIPASTTVINPAAAVAARAVSIAASSECY